MNDFSLIETMRFEPDAGIVRLRLHMARLANSCRKLGFPGFEEAKAALLRKVEILSARSRLRLELFPNGRHEIIAAAFEPLAENAVWTVRLARVARLGSSEPLLRHKTSKRAIYDAARAEFGPEECDEVLLLNDLGEVCEGTITNLFVEGPGGILLTPPLSSGCLAGVLRTSLLCGRKAKVARIRPEDLQRHAFYIGNSLRGLIRGRLVADP